MNSNRPKNIASAMLLAAAAALAPLGVQSEIRTRRNAPGERLLPPPPPRVRPRPGLSPEEGREALRAYHRKHGTKFDIARLDAAEAKRDRKAAHKARCVAAGATRQTATPRNSKES